MQQAVEAVFENGTFKVIYPSVLNLSEGQKVKLVVEEPSRAAADILALAAQVYGGLSKEEVDEIERIALDRRTSLERTSHNLAVTSAFRH